MRSAGSTALVVVADEEGEIDFVFFETTKRFIRRLIRFRTDRRRVKKVASEYDFGNIPFFAVLNDGLDDFFLLLKT